MFIADISDVARMLTSFIAVGMICVGLFFLFVAAIGVLRLPDVFTRAHAVSLTDSLGALFLLGGLALHEGFSTNSVKILVVLVLLYLLNPVIAHATVRSALRTGPKPRGRDDDDLLV